jgi:hypothetical protein
VLRRLRAIVFDCSSPATVARFWAAALGYSVRPYDEEDIARLRAMGIDDVEDDPSVALDPLDGEGPTLWFNRVPEPKIAKNRVHVDVDAVSAEEVERLVGLGATVLRPLGEVPDEPWVVMADPEGNEFCLFPPERPPRA